MTFQISFDTPTLEESLHIAQKVAGYADVLEVGTFLLLQYGIASVESFRKAFPNHIIFADTKIIDFGRDITNSYAQAGVDWISVMGGTRNAIIQNTCSKAHEFNKKVMLDLLDVHSVEQAALEAKNLGVDALVLHQSHEQDTFLFSEIWNMARGNTDLPLFITGKITRENIDKICALQPAGIIIGKTITSAVDPYQEAEFFASKCK